MYDGIVTAAAATTVVIIAAASVVIIIAARYDNINKFKSINIQCRHIG